VLTRTRPTLKYPITTQMLTNHPHVSIRIQVPAAAGRLPAEARAERVLLPRRREAINGRGRTLKAGAGKFIHLTLVWYGRLD
jgi:hypothetical protein